MLDWMFPVIFTAICLLVAEFIRRRINSVATDWIVAGAVTVVCCVFAYSTYNYLPMRDYRPYAIGQNIKENMKSAEDLGLEAPEFATEYTITNKATGVDSIMLSTDWLKAYSTDWFKNTYEKEIDYDGKEVLVKEGYSPLIADFAPMDFFGDNKMEEVLDYEGHTLVVVSKDITELMNVDSTPFVKMFAQAQKEGHRMIALVNGGTKEQIMTFQQKSGLNFTFYLMDDVELKTIIRSNPGLVHMKNATIMNKWSWKGLPDYSDIQFN